MIVCFLWSFWVTVVKFNWNKVNSVHLLLVFAVILNTYIYLIDNCAHISNYTVNNFSFIFIFKRMLNLVIMIIILTAAKMDLLWMYFHGMLSAVLCGLLKSRKKIRNQHNIHYLCAVIKFILFLFFSFHVCHFLF